MVPQAPVRAYAGARMSTRTVECVGVWGGWGWGVHMCPFTGGAYGWGWCLDVATDTFDKISDSLQSNGMAVEQPTSFETVTVAHSGGHGQGSGHLLHRSRRP